MANEPLLFIPTTLRDVLLSCAESFGDKAAFCQKEDRKYVEVFFNSFFADVEALGTRLLQDGLRGRKLLLMGGNCYTWAVAYLAVTCGGGIIMPISKDLPAGELGAVAAFGQADGILFDHSAAPAVQTLPQKISRYAFEDLPRLVAEGRISIDGGNTDYLETELYPSDTCEICFTSGSSDVPRGVVLSHENICYSVAEAVRAVKIGEKDTFLSVLPLHHIYETVCGLLAPLYAGAAVAFAENLRTIVRNMKEVKPTVMVCVPRIAEALWHKVKLDLEARDNRQRDEALISATNLLAPLNVAMTAKKKYFSSIHAKLGGHLRMIVVGGAPVDTAVLSGLRDVGILTAEGYGLCESAGLIAVNPPLLPKDGSVGICLPGSEVDIFNVQEDGFGEIRYKGKNVMQGYFMAPGRTADVKKDEWLYTGDLGFVDAKGYLHIVGRKANVIHTAAGKCVLPEELEALLRHSPFVREAVVVGFANEQKKDMDLVAVLVPDFAMMEKTYGKDYGKEDIATELEAAVGYANQNLPAYKHIDMYILRKEEFEKTGPRKIRRRGIAAGVEAEYRLRIRA